jgi:Rrf2 family protein
MVTRAADYALRATLALAGVPPGARVCLNELAGDCDVPPAFLYKVLGSLARSGLVLAHRGVIGGYELTDRARSATVLDVVEAVGGLPAVNACVMTGGCHRSPACAAHPIWIEAQAGLRAVLASARIADLAPRPPAEAPPASGPARRPRAGGRSRASLRIEPTSRRPAAEGRRSRGPYLKRMEDR